jgi:hypothetical protein
MDRAWCAAGSRWAALPITQAQQPARGTRRRQKTTIMVRLLIPLPRAMLTGLAGAVALSGVLVNFGDGTPLASELPAAAARGEATSIDRMSGGAAMRWTAAEPDGPAQSAELPATFVERSARVAGNEVKRRLVLLRGSVAGFDPGTLSVEPTSPAVKPDGARASSRPSARIPGTLAVPYRTQFDGSVWADGNCGPASLGMVLEFFGQPISTHALRESINGMTGDWSLASGLDWPTMQAAVQQRGLTAHGLFEAAGALRPWTFDELLAQTDAGRPVVLLVHYRSMPGHEAEEWYGDHYIVVIGRTPDGRIAYHDPGFEGRAGAYRTADPVTLERAWANTWIGQNRTAMAVGSQ